MLVGLALTLDAVEILTRAVNAGAAGGSSVNAGTAGGNSVNTCAGPGRPRNADAEVRDATNGCGTSKSCTRRCIHTRYSRGTSEI